MNGGEVVVDAKPQVCLCATCVMCGVMCFLCVMCGVMCVMCGVMCVIFGVIGGCVRVMWCLGGFYVVAAW